MLGIKNVGVVVDLIFLKHNGLCGCANFHNSWPSQEVIHHKIILNPNKAGLFEGRFFWGG